MKAALAALLLLTGMAAAPISLTPQDKLEPGLSNCTPVINPTEPQLIIMNQGKDSSSLSFEVLLLANKSESEGISAADSKYEKQIEPGRIHRVTIDYSGAKPAAKLVRLKSDGTPESTPLLQDFDSIKTLVVSDGALTLVDDKKIGGAIVLVHHKSWTTQVAFKDYVITETP